MLNWKEKAESNVLLIKSQIELEQSRDRFGPMCPGVDPYELMKFINENHPNKKRSIISRILSIIWGE